VGAGLIIVVSTLLTLLVKEVRHLQRQPAPVPVGAADQ
jgi:hypothetical protein